LRLLESPRVRKLILLVLLGACAKSSAPPPPAQPPAPAPAPTPALVPPTPAEEIAAPNRPLTTGEIALLKPIFRDGIDYAKVHVINNSFPLQPANVYMTPRGHVYAPGDLWQSDFSTMRGGTRAVFIHEMTHVWQYANGMDLIGQGVVEFTKYRGQYEKAYPYELARERDLVEYGMEQQASIIEDYFVITVDKGWPHRMTNKGVTDQQRDELYAAVMKKFLANARYARELDAAAVATQHAKSSEQKQPGPEACKESEQEHGTAHMCSWRYIPPTKP
jgi:hypothetical protein